MPSWASGERPRPRHTRLDPAERCLRAPGIGRCRSRETVRRGSLGRDACASVHAAPLQQDKTSSFLIHGGVCREVPVHPGPAFRAQFRKSDPGSFVSFPRKVGWEEAGPLTIRLPTPCSAAGGWSCFRSSLCSGEPAGRGRGHSGRQRQPGKPVGAGCKKKTHGCCRNTCCYNVCGSPWLRCMVWKQKKTKEWS